MLADAAAFLSRLVRLDRAAVVRLRPAGDRVTLWAALPWGVLVGRTVAGTLAAAVADDVTVGAAALLDTLGSGGALGSGGQPGSSGALGSGGPLPARRDADWRMALPPSAGVAVERVAAADLRRIALAAAGTLREASTQGVGGRAVGQRALRDALLDHVAIVATPPAGGSVEVPQRLVQAVVKMGFLGNTRAGADALVDIRTAGRWVGLSAPYGVAWLPPVSQFAVRPAGPRTNG
jgi:hypothetical protein